MNKVDVTIENLGFSKEKITFPVNPESIRITTPTNTRTVDIVGIGETHIQGRKQLATFELDAFFPAIWEGTPALPVNVIQRMQETDDHLRFTVTGLDTAPSYTQQVIMRQLFNMQCLITSFDYEVRAGEEADIYFTLAFKEFRPYGAKFIELKQEQVLTTTTSAPDSPPKQMTFADLKIGDIVHFKGGPHFVSSTATSPTGGTRTAGTATVTVKAKETAPNPIHLVGTSGAGRSNVYGWVRLSDIQGITTASTNTATPATPPRTGTNPAKTTTTTKTSQRTYKTVKGDTLGVVTRKVGGTGANWNDLYTENRTILSSGSAIANIPVGTVLKIPEKWGR